MGGDVDSDEYGDPVVDVDEVLGDDDDVGNEDVDDKVEDVGEPQRRVQGAPRESELEAGPLSLSTLQSNHQHNVDHNVYNHY